MSDTQRVALVTGGASGIGAALARHLRDRDVVVVAADLAPPGARPGSEGILSAELDVTDALAVRDLMEKTAADHGRLDYVFNNAGIFAASQFDETSDEVWQRVIDVNLWGVINGCRAAYPIMRRQGFGHIVNTASSAGVMPVASSVAYTASKHGVVGLSTSLRAEAVKHGVRVSVAIPGAVDTEIFDTGRDMTGVDYGKHIDQLPFNRISADQAASEILSGVDRNREFITFPRYNRVLWRLTRLAPGLMSGVINR